MFIDSICLLQCHTNKLKFKHCLFVCLSNVCLKFPDRQTYWAGGLSDFHTRSLWDADVDDSRNEIFNCSWLLISIIINRRANTQISLFSFENIFRFIYFALTIEIKTDYI